MAFSIEVNSEIERQTSRIFNFLNKLRAEIGRRDQEYRKLAAPQRADRERINILEVAVNALDREFRHCRLLIELTEENRAEEFEGEVIRTFTMVADQLDTLAGWAVR